MVDPLAVGVLVAVLVLALAGMALSWRLRSGSQRRLAAPSVPGEIGGVHAEATGLYLATTFAGRPLDRVVAAGLGFRARARLAVTDLGVLLERDGAAPVFLPAARLSGAGTASWTIDRAVERGGLLVIGWSLGGPDGEQAVESSFRLDTADRAGILEALGALHPVVPSEEPPRAER